MTAVPLPAPRAAGARRRWDDVVRLVATGLLAAALVLVTVWWVGDGGLEARLASVDTLVELGRWAGLLTAVLLLAQLVLMARIPWLEQAFGQDALARHHRIVGFVGFDLLLAHLVLISLGYAGGQVGALPATLWDLTVDVPGLLLADAALAALVLVVLTSLRAARRRLRYESWHLLHLYAYLGAGLALPHQLWTGAQFTSSPGRTVFWWTAWALAAAAVLVWRVGVPLARSWRHELRVTEVRPEAPGVVSVHLTGRRLDRLPVSAGQFLTWRFLGGPGWTRAHPYSLSAAPDGRSLRITARVGGDGGTALGALRPGSRALVEGPFGRLTARGRTRRRVALVGAGVGITPLRALAEGLDYRPGEAVLVQRYAEHALFGAELGRLATDRGLVVHLVGGHRDPADLLGLVPDVAAREVYVCGPDAWADEVRTVLLAAGLPERHLHVEAFAW